jgi:hypothetical protein
MLPDPSSLSRCSFCRILKVLWTRDRRGSWGDFWPELRLSHGVSVDTHTEPSLLEVFLVWSPPGLGTFFNFQVDSKTDDKLLVLGILSSGWPDGTVNKLFCWPPSFGPSLGRARFERRATVTAAEARPGRRGQRVLIRSGSDGARAATPAHYVILPVNNYRTSTSDSVT